MSPVGESAKKPAARKRWLTSRLIRYLSTMMGALLFFIVIFFLLEPKCCENTQYHKGIFGLRKHYSQLPPH
ncbi:hypothetical protein EB796_013001 [Bugula neritina]|uniref:Uncharacterized protein n=1 Tax=Bugula neritina TaxID=10212 RepID=A0A7J7JQQ7_BUGNE|nr:hypothetical protein EB796_013001 [Bugula neritina]